MHKGMRRDIERDFMAMRHAHPEVARELLVRAELANKDIELKSAYIKGALFVYTLFVFNAQATMLDRLFQASIKDGDVGEVPPPSTERHDDR